MVTSHRQLALLDRDLKRACEEIGMSARKTRELMTSHRELCSNMID
ncbi:MAG: hypothetical protein HUJ31_08430, partial [Pseudomonadales bacterium]|nr:hypothetical protein [Pseudomonadales bacterium]